MERVRENLSDSFKSSRSWSVELLQWWTMKRPRRLELFPQQHLLSPPPPCSPIVLVWGTERRRRRRKKERDNVYELVMKFKCLGESELVENLDDLSCSNQSINVVVAGPRVTTSSFPSLYLSSSFLFFFFCYPLIYLIYSCLEFSVRRVVMSIISIG